MEHTVSRNGTYSTARAPDFQENWHLEQQNSLGPSPGPAQWANEYSSSTLHIPRPQVQQLNLSVQADCEYDLQDTGWSGVDILLAQRALYLPNAYGLRSPIGMYNGGRTGFYANVNSSLVNQRKAKGKNREIDFEAAFEQVSASLASSQFDAAGIEETKEDVKDIKEGNSDHEM